VSQCTDTSSPPQKLTGERATVFDPLYPQKFIFDVYMVEVFGETYKFAAGEFSNCYWGFYCKRSEKPPMNRTIAMFWDETSRGERIRNLILKNMAEQSGFEMVLDIFIVEFDFFAEKASIKYYIFEDNMPDTEITFNELKILLTQF